MVHAIALAMASVLAMAAALPEPVPMAVKRAENIVGGTAATTGEFPYIVSLQFIAGNSHICGGMLVNAQTVVTAAHCSIGSSVTRWQARAGSLLYASGGATANISKIINHPAYNESNIDSDIAIWQLATPIAASSTIGYASMAPQGSDPVDGTLVTTAGWGLLSENAGKLSPDLQRVDVPIVGRAACQVSYGEESITDNMICAGFAEGGKDSCSSDSGGPIVENGILIGVVSFGRGCAEAGFPGVYTRLGNFVDWINENLA